VLHSCRAEEELNVEYVLYRGTEIFHFLDGICILQGPFERFVDCRQCATVIPSCSGGGNVVVA
jgi:hypothetical protein